MDAYPVVVDGPTSDGVATLRLGLVSEVVGIAELHAAAWLAARRIAQAPRWALARTKAKAIERTCISPTTRTLDL